MDLGLDVSVGQQHGGTISRRAVSRRA
jgi:hypothetical protein